MLVPLWLLGGAVLLLIDEPAIGGVAIGIGLVMLGGAIHLVRSMSRPDVVRDERVRSDQHRAGYNAFWAVVFVPGLFVALLIFSPPPIADPLARWGGYELAWPLSLVCGFAVYLGSITYHRVAGA